MTTRWFVSTLAMNGLCTGVTALLLIVARIAGTWPELAQALPAVVLSCAPCVDPSDILGLGWLVLGSTGAIAAAGAMGAWDPYEDRRKSDWATYSKYRKRQQETGEPIPEWVPDRHILLNPEETTYPPHGAHEADVMVKIGKQLQEWAEDLVGADTVQTVPAGGKA